MSRWCRDWPEELPPQVTKYLHPKVCLPPECVFSRLDVKVVVFILYPNYIMIRWEDDDYLLLEDFPWLEDRILLNK
jgi:hypothetical protein